MKKMPAALHYGAEQMFSEISYYIQVYSHNDNKWIKQSVLNNTLMLLDQDS